MSKTNSILKSENVIRPSLLTAIIFFTALTGVAQDNLHRSFDGVKEIQISSSLGDWKFSRGASPDVIVSLRHTFTDPSFQTSIDQEDSVLVIKENYAGRNILQGQANPKAFWTIEVPDHIIISFTGSGVFEASDLKSQLDVTNGGGSTLVRNLTMTGVCHFRSGSGDIIVTLAESPKDDLSLNSGSGQTELNFNGHEIEGEIVMIASKKKGKIIAPFHFDKIEEYNSAYTSKSRGGKREINNINPMIMMRKTVLTVFRGNSAPKISISTGSGDAILKKA